MVVSETKTVAATEKLAHSSAPMALQQSDQEVPLQEPDPTFSQLNKQNSILSLTLDEFQCKSGKSFGSLNMDEFLASIWNSSDNQINQQIPHDEAAQPQIKSVAIATEPNIPQQGTFSVPPPMCKKTVDEVWSEIHKNQPQWKEANNNLGRNETLKKQQTLGEMTLEDFLIKAGVVQESSSSSLPFKSSPQLQPRTTMSFQTQTCNTSSNRPLTASYGLRPAMGIGFSNQLANATYQMLSQNNSLAIQDHVVEKCQSLPESSSGCSNRKRIIDGPPEVVVERRQRRMLKNRESAARSRARRQAYTVELEAELNLLKEENEKLKQILAEAESKRKQEISQRKHSTKTRKGTEKLRAIRRPISASW